jgi:hypothetical protein
MTIVSNDVLNIQSSTNSSPNGQVLTMTVTYLVQFQDYFEPYKMFKTATNGGAPIIGAACPLDSNLTCSDIGNFRPIESSGVLAGFDPSGSSSLAINKYFTYDITYRSDYVSFTKDRLSFNCSKRTNSVIKDIAGTYIANKAGDVYENIQIESIDTLQFSIEGYRTTAMPPKCDKGIVYTNSDVLTLDWVTIPAGYATITSCSISPKINIGGTDYYYHNWQLEAIWNGSSAPTGRPEITYDLYVPNVGFRQKVTGSTALVTCYDQVLTNNTNNGQPATSPKFLDSSGKQAVDGVSGINYLSFDVTNSYSFSSFFGWTF